MRNTLWLAVVSVALCAGSVQAQGFPGGYNPANQPAVSPWLQLNRLGAPASLNYYNLVKPQFQFGSAIQGLENQQALSSAQQTSFQNYLTLPATGHQASFNTHLRYYDTAGGGGGYGMMGGMGMGGMMGGMGMGGMGMGGMMGGMGMGGMGMGGMGTGAASSGRR
jgi:hypothetical protein